MAHEPEHIVLGAAVGYDIDQIRPFLTSLRKTGYRGSIVLLADAHLRRQLRSDPDGADVAVLPAGPWLPKRLGLLRRPRAMRLIWAPIQLLAWRAIRLVARAPIGERPRLALQMRLAHLVWTPMEARFVRFYGFLRRRPHARVVISDVRDVLFQGDPFRELPPEGLGVSIETDRYTIGTEVHNAAWLARTYGPEMLERLGDRRVSCVGVTYGDGAAIGTYLELFTRELMRLHPRAVGMGGADTAIHNVLVWTEQLETIHLMETLASPIATLNALDEDDIPVDADGRIHNVDGTRPSIVHQYDRVPQLGARLLTAITLRCATDQAGSSSTWARTSTSPSL